LRAGPERFRIEHDRHAAGSRSRQSRADDLAGRIHNTRKLLIVAALIMVFALASSALVTTLLIPAEAMEPGGAPSTARMPTWLMAAS